MKDHFYFEVMRRTIIQFLDMFNELRIARYDLETGKLLKYISVPLSFAPKTKYFWWQEKTAADGRKIRDILLPYIGIHLTNVALDKERLVNKNAKIRHERLLQEVKQSRFDNPVPYTFTFEVGIASEYMIDATQILEQILPFFDPTAFIRITIPELFVGHKETEDEEGAFSMDLKVIYDGASKDAPVEIAEDERRTILWTLTFNVEGYLFKPAISTPVIEKAITEYYVGQQITDTPTFTTTLCGLSAEKWPRTVTAPELSGAIYDESIKLLYKYERVGD